MKQGAHFVFCCSRINYSFVIVFMGTSLLQNLDQVMASVVKQLVSRTDLSKPFSGHWEVNCGNLRLKSVCVCVQQGDYRTNELAQTKSPRTLQSSQSVPANAYLIWSLPPRLLLVNKLKSSVLYIQIKFCILFAAQLDKNIWITIEQFKVFWIRFISKNDFSRMSVYWMHSTGQNNGVNWKLKVLWRKNKYKFYLC